MRMEDGAVMMRETLAAMLQSFGLLMSILCLLLYIWASPQALLTRPECTILVWCSGLVSQHSANAALDT